MARSLSSPPSSSSSSRSRRWRSSGLPLLALCFALVALVLAPLGASATCAVDADCSGHGSCLGSLVCQCNSGWLGATCNIGSTPSQPVYVALIEGLKGQEIMQEWRVIPPATAGASSTLHMRWTVNTNTWWGVIFDVGYDGMTSGDSWNFWVSKMVVGTAPNVYLGDYFSSGRSQPDQDKQQDLTWTNAWRSADGEVQSVEFTRPFLTSDTANDYMISEAAGTWTRLMWTTGLTENGLSGGGHGGSSTTVTTPTNPPTASLPKLSMHGYLGYCGQYRVDFAGGKLEVLKDGVEWSEQTHTHTRLQQNMRARCSVCQPEQACFRWLTLFLSLSLPVGRVLSLLPVFRPQGYWWALGFFVFFFLTFGLCLQLPSVMLGRCGRFLRSRPLLGITEVKGTGKPRNSSAAAAATAGAPYGSNGKGAANGAGVLVVPASSAKITFARPSSDAFYHQATFQLIPTMRNLSVAGILAFLVYVGAIVAIVASSVSDYNVVGRSIGYIIGHLASMHLALALLPVTRNSFWLWVCNLPFDVAIVWHRRLGNAAIGFTLAHLASMVIVWSPEVLFDAQDVQFGMGCLWGTLSFIAFLVLGFSSFNSIRRKHYDWFLHFHLVCVALGYVGALMHSINFRYLLIVPGAMYIVDYALRRLLTPWVKFGGAVLPQVAGAGAAGASSAAVVVVPGAAPVTAVHSSFGCGNRLRASIVSLECCGSNEAQSLNDKVLVVTLSVRRDFPGAPDALHPDFPTGSWLMLRVPEISHLMTHPFTISSCRTTEDATILTLHIQAVSPPGDRQRQQVLERVIHKEVAIEQPSRNHTWTQELYVRSKAVMAKGQEKIVYDGVEGDLEGGAGSVAVNSKPPFSLYLDGPYLSVCMPMLRYRVLILVAGGIGVTPVMSLLEDYMLRLALATASGDKNKIDELPARIYVTWTSRSANSFQKWFPRQMADIARCPRIHMQLYSTNSSFEVDRIAAGFGDNFSALGSSAAIDVKGPAGVEVPAAQVTQGSVELVSALPVPVAAGAGPAFTFDGEEEEKSPHAASHMLPNGNGNAAASSGATSSRAIMVQPKLAQAPAQRLVLLSGRPDFSALMDLVVRDLAALPVSAVAPTPAAPHNVLVMSCGPDRMVEDAEAEAERRGFQFVHEAFNY